MTLDAVKAAVVARGAAEREWRLAVLAACREHSCAEVARASGVSRQAVAQLVRRAAAEVAAERGCLVAGSLAQDGALESEAQGEQGAQ